MLPSSLVLTSLGHCYVILPEAFITKEPTIKVGAVISIKSVQNDNEIIVMWNGQVTSNGSRHVEIDLDFGQANKFQDELIVISLLSKFNLVECSTCRVELLNSAEYNIISQHLEANVLDRCRLVSKDLIIPIWFSQHVKVLVRVVDLQPDKSIGTLTKWTEMQFQHTLDKPIVNDQDVEPDKQESPIESQIPLVSCSLGLDYKPKFSLGGMLIHGDRGCGKTHLLKTIIKNYRKYHNELFNCKQLRGKRPEMVKKKLFELLEDALENQPSILALDDIDSFASNDAKNEDEKGQDIIYKKRLVDAFCSMFKQLERFEHKKGRHVIIIATCRSIDSLDVRLSKPVGREYFSHILHITNPNLKTRITIIRAILAEQEQVKSNVSDEEYLAVAERCASFMPLDIRRLVERAIIKASSRSLLGFDTELLTIQVDDLLSALNDYVPANLRGVALQVKTQKTFDDIGGMREIKDLLMKTILLQIKYTKLFKKCPMRPETSILLYGPSGCGKTLLAEALTNHELINSICVKGPELLSKYIGASEAAVRNLFKRAELAKPCVIFFDEFESLVSKRGADSTGVTDRIVNQFLTIMDGVERLSDGIFIVAATSRPDMIDPAMLRPGRLGKHIYCAIPNQEDRLDILKVLSRNIELEREEVNLKEWSHKLECYTGADIQSLLYSAQLAAFHEIIDHKSTGEGSRLSQDFIIKVRNVHLQEAFNSTKDEVKSRYFKLLEQCPPSLNRRINQGTKTILL